MIATLEQPRRSPADRDLDIYAAVRVDGRRQVDVAAEYGITQSRVSQIIGRVNRWRAGMGAAAQLEHRDRQSVDRWLDIQRIEKLYEHTMELYRRSCLPRKKERRGKNASGEWSFESLDHQPGNLQCLKFAAKLLELKSQLDQQAPPSPRVLEAVDERILFDRLAEMRVWAEERGDVTSDLAPARVVQCLLDELLGRGRHQPRPVRQPEDFLDEEEAAEAANAPASMSDISAGPPAEETLVSGRALAVRDCPVATSDEPQAATEASVERGSGANNSAVFVGPAGLAEPDWPRDVDSPAEVQSLWPSEACQDGEPWPAKDSRPPGAGPAEQASGQRERADGAALGPMDCQREAHASRSPIAAL